MNERILIIDSDRDILKCLEILLGQEGYQIRSASRGEEAIEIFKSESFDLVIMDIRVPGIDGLELMKRIKNSDEEIAIIVLTGAVSIHNAVKVLRDEKAFDFLLKPLENGDQLIFRVREALQQRMLSKKRKTSTKELEKSYLRMESRLRELTTELRKINGDQPSRKKVLIVDDDPQIQELLTEMLSAHQYETEVASDGFEAGVKVIEFKPGLITLDLIMPGMDGFDVCKRIKQNSSTSQIKILAITGYDTRDNREKIMKAGADDYLAKPVVMDILLQKVDKLLNSEEKSGR